MTALTESQILWLLAAAVGLLLVARLLSGRFTVRGVLQTLASWTAIGLIGFIAFTHQQEIGRMLTRAYERFGPEPQVVQGDTVRIAMSRDGHFWARVQINGVERRMLVDSGATITALSEDTAAEAGIAPGSGGMPVIITTANGSIPARTANAETVAIGPLSTRNLDVVVATNFGDMDVLGMNFLSRLKSWRVEGETLVLEPMRAGDADSAEERTGTRDERERPRRERERPERARERPAKETAR